MNHTITQIVLWLTFIKMSVCYFSESLLKINSNTIGDNLASHNIQQVMIYKTHQHIEVFWVFIC
jgi:hypothetical protein